MSLLAFGIDAALCELFSAVQSRHRLGAGSRLALERYIAEGERMGREDYFAVPPMERLREGRHLVEWKSPVATGFKENDTARVLCFPSGRGPGAPALILLHALMSSNDAGYRRWAQRLNGLGWDVYFPHLPFHYSRTPAGFWNGELAIGPDLVRTAEGLRQAVSEIRQLMRMLAARGAAGFGLWATSYGGWIGALLASLEPGLRFVGLITPIVDVRHAIWEGPAGKRIRHELRRLGVAPEMVARHEHLTSPAHGTPLCGGERVVFLAGAHDRIAPEETVRRLHARWPGSRFALVDQGHFGFKAMPELYRIMRGMTGGPGEGR